MKKIILFFIFMTSLVYANENVKKVLYINSYHVGYSWSDGIEKVIKDNLKKSQFNIDLKIFRMNSKRNNNETFIKHKALEAKKIIEEYKPDVVILSDDNAVKYLLVPYFNNSAIPFIYCGVNGSATKYNLSANNVAGMIEVKLVFESIKNIQNFAKGEKIGYLSDDTISARNDGLFFEKSLNKTIKHAYVNTIKEWKSEFLKFQDSVDILFLGYPASLYNWKIRQYQLKTFTKKHTKIPSTAWNVALNNLALLTFSTSAAELGDWASKKAIEVLEGKRIIDIPSVQNKKGNIYVNITLAKKLGIVFPFDLIEHSELVE